ncbi:hypothetical protein BC629DRAFT_1472883, partial [Irpex lacteus]
TDGTGGILNPIVCCSCHLCNDKHFASPPLDERCQSSDCIFRCLGTITPQQGNLETSRCHSSAEPAVFLLFLTRGRR